MSASSMPDMPSQKSRGIGPAAGLFCVLCLGALSAPAAEPNPVSAAPALALPAPLPATGDASRSASATGAESAADADLEDRRQALSQPTPPDQPAGSAAHRVPPTDGPRTRDSLDADLVYAVLVAEVAARRGDLVIAFAHYLHAAQLVRDPKIAELAVRTAISGDDDAGAARAVALWLEIAPNSPGAHQIAAVLRLKAGEREEALVHLTRVVQLAADPEYGYQQAAGIIGRAASPPERVALMSALVARDETNADAQQALAMVAASVDQFEVAAATAARAQALRPDWDKPRLFVVKLLLAEGKRGEARAQIEQFIAARPDDRTLRLLYAQYLIDEKDYPGARSVFTQLLQDQPRAPEVLFAAGILSLELDDLAAARDYLTRLYETGERRDEASFYLGQIEERAEQPSAAIDWYAKSQGANLMEVRLRTAVLRAKAGEVERAREIIQQLRDLAPDEAPALFLAEAEILAQVGRLDAAMQVYADALAVFQDDAQLLYGRAMHAVKLERIGQAEQDLRRIIEQHPDHADALNALGYTLADRTDRYQEAQGYIERAYQLKPTQPAILDSAGWVNYKLGRYEAALEYLRKANDAMKDGEIAAHLGEVLWALDRQAEAQAVWDAALKDHPDHAYLLKVMGRHPVPDMAEPSGETPQEAAPQLPNPAPNQAGSETPQ